MGTAPVVLRTRTALLISGNCSGGNSTSITAPMTCTMCPTFCLVAVAVM